MTSRGKARKADCILFCKPNLPLAVVEARDNNHSVGAGMQQALDDAETLDVPFADSSNGDAFLERDPRPALVFVGAAALFLGWRVVMQVRATMDTAMKVATFVENNVPSPSQQTTARRGSDSLDRASAFAGDLLTHAYEAKKRSEAPRAVARGWSTYSNSRFPFAFDYPADGLILETESGSGDGATFKSPDDVLQVRAYAFVTENPWRDCASLGPPHGGGIDYERELPDGCVVSGTTFDKIFYIRAVSSRPDMAAVLELWYPREAKSRVNEILPRMANSLRFE